MRKFIALLTALIFACSPVVFASSYQSNETDPVWSAYLIATPPVTTEVDPTVDTSGEIVTIIGAGVYATDAQGALADSAIQTEVDPTVDTSGEVVAIIGAGVYATNAQGALADSAIQTEVDPTVDTSGEVVAIIGAGVYATDAQGALADSAIQTEVDPTVDTSGEITTIIGDGVYAPHGSNVVVVAKSGGEYTTVQAAITYAATQTPSAVNPWTVVVYPGVYDEVIAMSSYVNLKGVGTRGSVVLYHADADVVTLATNVELENLTVRTGATGDIHTITDNGVACVAKITDVTLESTYTGNGGWAGLFITGAGNYTLDRIYVYNTALLGGTGDQLVVLILAVAANVKITNSDIHMEGAPGSTSSKSILGIVATSGATILSAGNRYSGDAFCNMIYAEDGTVISDFDTIHTLYADQTAGATVTYNNGYTGTGTCTITTITNGIVTGASCV